MFVRRILPTLIALLLLTAEPHVPQLQLLHGHAHAQEQLPPVSYICPMDAEVVDDKPGRCPICRMDLEPVRLDLAFSCPNHAAVITAKPGVCPIDKRELVQVTVSKYWTCPDAADKSRLLEPGNCANGQPRKLEQALRAHGDHNPRYGGQFFMAVGQMASPRRHVSPRGPVPDVFLRQLHQAHFRKRVYGPAGDARGEQP